jgi:GNAT superfamily N-acetyltransferase
MTEGGLGDPFVFEMDIDEGRAEYIGQRLQEFNAAHSGKTVSWDDPQLPPSFLQVYVLDRAGTLMGGFKGRIHTIPTWLEVTCIWVDETVRGRGLGRQLMERAEALARSRGCRYARLATCDFNAPGFYEKLGYRLYGTLANCPPGETVFYYWKEL